MTRLISCLVLAAVAAAPTPAPAADKAEKRKQAPLAHLGYIYPAGGRSGETFRVLAGGQNMFALVGARISGEGVTARLVGKYKELPNLDKETVGVVRKRIAARRAVLKGEPPGELTAEEDETEEDVPNVPKYALLDAIPYMTARELSDLEHLYFNARRRLQNSPQLGMLAQFVIRIAPDAAPGRREFRLDSRNGLSNPLAFEVGVLPERSFPTVPDPANLHSAAHVEQPAPAPPFTANGRVLPGETVRIPFEGKKGERFAARLEARSLVPYLADAVPGWFQAVMVIRNPEGREIAFSDDFLFRPDPFIQGVLPESGTYMLEVRDALHRGRQDFVFRAHIGDIPVVWGCYPPVTGTSAPTRASLLGSGLRALDINLDGSPEGTPVRRATVPGSQGLEIPYRVTPHALHEASPDNTPRIAVPAAVYGRLPAGAVQRIAFHAEAGDPLTLSVAARRLGSALDAAMVVHAPDGSITAQADDTMEKDGHLFLGPGMLTHHADPELEMTANQSGWHTLTLRDVSGQGGPLHFYVVEFTKTTPSFQLAVTPSAINFDNALNAKATVRILRTGGFNQPVKLAVQPDAIKIQPDTIPSGADTLEVTLHCSDNKRKGTPAIAIVGKAATGDASAGVHALPADDTMQAFLWRHLLPARELVAHFPKGGQPKPKPNTNTDGKTKPNSGKPVNNP